MGRINKKGRRPQNDQRADLRGKGFASIPTIVLESEAWRTSGLLERAIMIELVNLHNGFNNGQIGASQRYLGERLNMQNYGAIGRAVAGLMMRGFIDVAAESNRHQRLAREYRLTWLPTGEPPHRKPATDEWRQFSSAEHGSAETPDLAEHGSAGRKKLAEHVSAELARKRQKTVADQ